MAAQEKEYYRSGEVLITNTRAELGGRTFAMANITAVSMTTINLFPGCGLFMLGLGVIIALSGLLTIEMSGAVWLVIGLIMAGVGYIWWKMAKPSYAVNISSASGESRAMQSHNKEEIEHIVAAIKQAIIERG